jgi:hypothetical protein
VYLNEEQIVDVVNKEIIARQVRVGAGYGSFALGGTGSWKFWLQLPNCDKGRMAFSQFAEMLKYQGDR